MSTPNLRAARAAGPDPTRRGLSPRAVIVHVAALAVVLLFFRIEKGFQLTPSPSGGEWLGLIVPEAGFVVAFAAVWLAVVALSRRWSTVARGLFLTCLVAVYLVALLDHLWFLFTGTRLHLSLLVYSIRYFEMLLGLLATGANAVFWIRLLLVALCFLLALRLERLGAGSPGGETGRSTQLRRAAVAATAAGAVLLPPWPVPYRIADLWASPPLEFFSSIRVERLTVEELAPYTARPDELYRAPEVLGIEGGRRPDILLILLESTRRDVTPPFAPAELAGLTPALDAVTGRSVVFEDVYASVSHTSKALVGILCGTFPRRDMRIVEATPGALGIPCLPGLLADAGYRTGFLQTAPGAFERRPGLVANLGYEFAAFGEQLVAGGRFERVGYLGLDEFAMLGAALRFLAEPPDPRPTFLTVLTVVPHHPYQVPGQRDRWLGETQAQYLAAIHHQDRFVGALLGSLQRTGALEDMLVVLLGDHGEAFGEHRRLQHDAVPYQEVIHVPLMMLGDPDWIGPPRRVGGLRHQVDLMPTLLRLAGVEWRGELPGRDLFQTRGHDRVFSFCWYRDYCMAMIEATGEGGRGRRKFVHHFGRRPPEAFELGDDPGEQRDVADQLPTGELREAERRMLGRARSIDRFWASQTAPVQAEP